MNLHFNRSFLVSWIRRIPFGQTCFALSILQQHKMNHSCGPISACLSILFDLCSLEMTTVCSSLKNLFQ